jgi:hypothetical protein
MKRTVGNQTTTLLFTGMLLLCLSAGAQQTAQPGVLRLQSYELSREVSLVGTVVKYETASSIPPMGAHLLLQTSSGQVDVHVGNARVLQANHLELNAGDNVRIVGENLASESGTFFAARIVQKGLQAVAVRTTKGFLMKPGAGNSPSETEALRGVR